MNRMQTILTFAVAFVAIAAVNSAAVDGSEHHSSQDRVLHGQPLSSHHQHENDLGEHDYDYDHEAFLGDEAEEFDHLTPEESQHRLAAIVDKIDKDGDGYVTLEELQAWIKFTQQRYVSEDVERQWTSHLDSDPQVAIESVQESGISWEQYRKSVYGFLDQNNDEDEAREEHEQTYKKMEERDRRRWDLADENKDGRLTKEEFSHFLHPEEAEHMRDIVVQETLEDIDKDGDGKISLVEYIGDMYHQDEATGDLEPEWVTAEKEQFSKYRDADNDGYMDLDEVRAWIIPEDFDPSDAEAKHLLNESDSDSDGKLTKDEILEKYDLFVGSQATDFGEALSRHDEF